MKNDKQLRHVLVNNNKKPVNLYVLKRGKSSRIESEIVNAVEEHVHDVEDKCDVDDEQGGDGDEFIGYRFFGLHRKSECYRRI